MWDRKERVVVSAYDERKLITPNYKIIYNISNLLNCSFDKIINRNYFNLFLTNLEAT